MSSLDAQSRALSSSETATSTAENSSDEQEVSIDTPIDKTKTKTEAESDSNAIDTTNTTITPTTSTKKKKKTKSSRKSVDLRSLKPRRARTWTSVKDVYREDISIKTKQFEEKKKFLEQIGVIDDRVVKNQAANVPKTSVTDPNLYFL